MDDGWPGEGIFPHTVAYCAGVGVSTCGFGGGAGDGGRTGVHHVGDVGRRHEGGGRAFVISLRDLKKKSRF